jgi:hypothetical protein
MSCTSICGGGAAAAVVVAVAGNDMENMEERQVEK